MRKFLIAAAVATSALTAAAPAAAQYYPAPQPYGYGYQQPYGYGAGYNGYSQRGLIRSYLVRVDQLRQRIERFDHRDRISEREARNLRQEANGLRDRIRRASQNGLRGRERQDIEYRLARLEQRIRLERADRNGRPGFGESRRDRDHDGRVDRNDGWVDRDRDGRDDRWERRGRR